MNRRSSGYAVLALVSSAVALYFGTGLHLVWWLTWLAPIPVLAVAPRYSQRFAFVIAFVAWALGAFNRPHGDSAWSGKRIQYCTHAKTGNVDPKTAMIQCAP